LKLHINAGPYAEWFVSYSLLDCHFHTGLWRRVIPYTWYRLRAHGRCDRSAEDAYSSAAPDHTLAFVWGLCCPTLDFVIAFWIMITFYTLLTSLFCIYKLHMVWRFDDKEYFDIFLKEHPCSKFMKLQISIQMHIYISLFHHLSNILIINLIYYNDWSAGDAHSSVAPDPAFAFVGVHIVLHSILYLPFLSLLPYTHCQLD
jgi:hypothetical protein